MYKYIAIIIIIIILFSIFYIKHNINIWIHNRQVRPFILKIINHPLYNAYKYSLYLEYNILKRRLNLRLNYIYIYIYII